MVKITRALRPTHLHLRLTRFEVITANHDVMLFRKLDDSRHERVLQCARGDAKSRHLIIR